MAVPGSTSAVGASEYIDEDGLHERYLIPPRTAQRWRAAGGGPAFVRLGKRRIAYRVSDVEAWLAARTFNSRAHELARQTGTCPETHPVPTAGAEIAAQHPQREAPRRPRRARRT